MGDYKESRGEDADKSVPVGGVKGGGALSESPTHARERS